MPSRTPRFAVGILLAALPALTVACGAAKPIHYYSLEFSAPVPSGADPLPVALTIGRITAPIVYRDTRLLYRSGPNQVDIYEQQRWAEAPAELVRGMLLRVLRASGHYRTVNLAGSNVYGDYVVRGRVLHFEEVDTPSLSARVGFEVELYDPAKGMTIWSHLYEQDEPASGKDVPSVVAAINRNVQRGLGEVAAGLEQYVAQHPPSAPAAKTAP
jgi:ABC-type uncharacterized transport system auxiliary subunit